MRPNPLHAEEDPEVVRGPIREHPWGILVSQNDGELVASHNPVLLDDESEDPSVLTRVGRPDDVIHGFGDRAILLIIQGRNGYVSPSWYVPCEHRSRSAARTGRKRQDCWSESTLRSGLRPGVGWPA